ncbi:MAG: TIGR00159 family protein [Gracilibacteraceae bacterium]|jgi:diadenylate cyclase|nr:TIGR00159 family protein [Gracilibacteraceae bacterium]
MHKRCIEVNELKELLPYLKMWNTYVDIGIIAIIIYKVMNLIKETRAEQLIKGLAMLIIATKLSEVLGFHTVYWLLKNAMTVGVIAILIIFQPELRRALEHLGRGRFFVKGEFLDQETDSMLDEVCVAVAQLSKTKTGAIIVIEQETGLNEYIETGTKLDSIVTNEILMNLFIPNTPLHDGAVIIRGNRIAAAGCFLPLTQSQNLSKELGTRHRAAIGITEISDSMVIIVSEESGVISFAKMGRLSRYLDTKSLREIVKNSIKAKESKQPIWMKWSAKNE